MSQTSIPETPGDLTPDWLTAALRAGGVLAEASVRNLDTTIIGQEFGFTGIVCRVSLKYDRAEPGAPASIVAKFPNAAGETLSTYRDTVQRDPVAVRRYYERCAREIWFYQQIEPEGTTLAPRMYHGVADLDAGRFVLLLEDLAAMRLGDALAGCPADDAAAVLRAMGVFHANWWENPELHNVSWLTDWRGDVAARQARFSQHAGPFLARFGDRLPSVIRQMVLNLEPVLGEIINELADAPATLIHADLHLDNVAFDESGSATVIDWQRISTGPAAFDLAAFLSGSIDPDVRAQSESDLLRDYHQTLIANGVIGYSYDRFEHDYGLSLLSLLAGYASWLGSIDLDHLAGRERQLVNAVTEDGRLASALLHSRAGTILARFVP